MAEWKDRRKKQMAGMTKLYTIIPGNKTNCISSRSTVWDFIKTSCWVRELSELLIFSLPNFCMSFIIRSKGWRISSKTNLKIKIQSHLLAEFCKTGFDLTIEGHSMDVKKMSYCWLKLTVIHLTGSGITILTKSTIQI